MKKFIYLLFLFCIEMSGQTFDVGDSVIFKNYPASVSIIQEIRNHKSDKNFKLKIYSDAGVFNRWSSFSNIIPFQPEKKSSKNTPAQKKDSVIDYTDSLYKEHNIFIDLTGTLSDCDPNNYPSAFRSVIDKNYLTCNDSIEFKNIIKKNGVVFIIGNSNNNLIEFDYRDVVAFFEFDRNSIENLWKIESLVNDVYYYIIRDGLNYAERYYYEQQALSRLYNDANKVDDVYVTSYIYNLISNVFQKSHIIDGRDYQISVTISSSSGTDAYITPNGSIVISSGLISLMKTEEELLSILCHEIAHYVLDHTFVNYKKQLEGVKRAKLWAGITGVLVGVAAATSGNKNTAESIGYGMSTYVLASSLSSAALKQLGYDYNRYQEKSADLVAIKLLEFLDIPSYNLAIALERIKSNQIKKGADVNKVSSTHPSFDARINYILNETNVDYNTFENLFLNAQDDKYDYEFSEILYHQAAGLYNKMKYEESIKLLNRKINSNIGDDRDYLLLTKNYLNLPNYESNNDSIVEFLEIGLTKSAHKPLDYFKYCSLAHYRAENFPESKSYINRYLETLNDQMNKLSLIKSDDFWESNYLLLKKEIVWSKEQLFKISEKISN